MGCGNSSVSSLDQNQSDHNFTIIFYILETTENKYFKFTEKANSKFKYDTKKSNIFLYLESGNNKLLKGLKENLESLIYVFRFKNGNQNILNYYNAESINPSEGLSFSPPRLLDKIWLIDIQDCDISPEDVIEMIKSQEDIKNFKFEADQEGTSEAEIQNENDNGYVDDKDPEDGIQLDIFREITQETKSEIISKLETNKVTSIQIKKNLFRNMELFEQVVNEGIKHGSSITRFTFSDNFNATGFEKGWQLLMEIITKLENLHHLNLSMSFLYDKYLKQMFNGLRKKRLITLDLSSNFITHVGANIIARWLKNNKTLKVLNLQQNTMNEFKREGFEVIIEQLYNHPNIMQLDVSHMVLTGFSTKMSHFLKVCKTIEILKIKNTRMNFEDFVELIPVIRDNKTLKEINLSENDAMKDESIELLGEMLEKNTSLEIVYLDKIGLNIGNFRSLFDGLKKNSHIHSISLNDHPKMKIEAYLDFFKGMGNIKILNIFVKNYKKSEKENELIENFKKERPDVTLKV